MSQMYTGPNGDVWFTSGAAILDDHSGTLIVYTTTGNFRVTSPVAPVVAFFDAQADERTQTVTPISTV